MHGPGEAKSRKGRSPACGPTLELAVVGTDIREDSRRYSVFIVQVRQRPHRDSLRCTAKQRTALEECGS